VTTSRVHLGQTGDRSVTATVYGLVDRGATLRPHLVERMQGSVRIVFVETYAPVRLVFTGTSILVADDAAGDPVDLEVHAALTDLVLLVSAPLAGGVPKPTTRTGRAALARWVDGRVDFKGSMSLARKLLQLLSVAPP
jgi:hypothetical protein